MTHPFLIFPTGGWAVAVVIGIGILLWLAGSRFSQGLVTLAAVAVGAAVGKLLPGWMGWGVDPIGTCFGGALALGIAGYLYHRMWVGVGLGVLAAGWAAVGTWLILGNGQSWLTPVVTQFDVAMIAKAVWESIPADLQTIFPWTVGGAAMVAMTVAGIWPRFAGRMFYSMLGVSVIAAAGMCMRTTSLLPSGAYVQLFMAVAFVAAGMTVQSWVGPRRMDVAETPDQLPEAA